MFLLSRGRQRGLTLIELIIASAILLTLATMALPLARVRVKREKEIELRRALREMRAAIDHFKEASDRGLIPVKAGSEGYPPDLETLVDGVDLGGVESRHVRFLRRIPLDPLTGGLDWGLRSIQDEPNSLSWGGDNVFDVYSKSRGTALDGTRYNDW